MTSQTKLFALLLSGSHPCLLIGHYFSPRLPSLGWNSNNIIVSKKHVVWGTFFLWSWGLWPRSQAEFGSLQLELFGDGCLVQSWLHGPEFQQSLIWLATGNSTHNKNYISYNKNDCPRATYFYWLRIDKTQEFAKCGIQSTVLELSKHYITNNINLSLVSFLF